MILFINTLKLDVTEGNFPGVSVCERYPEKVPGFVPEAIKDCPKFQAREEKK